MRTSKKLLFSVKPHPDTVAVVPTKVFDVIERVGKVIALIAA